MVKESFGLPVATNIDDIKPDHLPAILIVSKAGSNVEVNNIIQGEFSQWVCLVRVPKT